MNKIFCDFQQVGCVCYGFSILTDVKRGGKNALIYLQNYYPKCKEVVFPFLTVGFQHLLVVVKRLQQTHHLRIHLSSASLRECVCSPYSCWAGISICIWTDVWAWEETGETLLAPGLKSLLELLI